MFKNIIPWHKKHEAHPVPSPNDRSTSMAHDIETLRHEYDKMLDRFWNGNLWEDFDRWNVGWGCDVEDNDKEVVVSAAVPGFKPEEIDIQLSGDRLRLRAEHNEESKKNGGFRQNRFFRSMTMPRGINANEIKAEYKNGVLEIHLPKGPDSQTKRIPVKAQ